MYKKFIDTYNSNLKKIRSKLNDICTISFKKIKSKINSNEEIKNKYKTIKGKLIGSKKIIESSFSEAQDSIEKSFKSFVFDESLLKQSSFWIKSVTWTLLGTSTFVIVWLSFAKTDEVVFAIGKLEPKGDVKDIQIPLGGVIEEIFVEAGDIVEENQKLIQLDRESSYGQFVSLNSSIAEKEVQLKKNKNILDLKKLQKIEEEKLTVERSDLLSKKLEINTKILSSLKKLVDEGAISEFEYLNQEIKYKELISSLKQTDYEGNRNAALLTQEIRNLESEQARIKSELSTLKAQLIQIKVNLKYLSIKSPVKGIIFDLKPTAPGYVAQSSEPIMKVVPFNDLEADIQIPSDKIGFVKKGMPVDISIDSFPASDFGVIKGKIIHIGSDTLSPNQSELREEYVYPARIKLDNQYLKVNDGRNLSLQVGMTLRANIKLRKVTYLNLLLSSLQNKTDSIRQF